MGHGTKVSYSWSDYSSAVTLEQILVPMGDLMNTADRQSGALSASLQGKIKQAQQTWNMIQQCQSSALNDISDW